MAVLSLSVTQLKCACLDAEWRRRWKAGQKPPTAHFAPAGSPVVYGARFHKLAQRFLEWLIKTKASRLETSDQLWTELFRRFAEAEIDGIVAAGKIESALFLSEALQAFCGRVSRLRQETEQFTAWSDLFIGQEHAVRDAHFLIGRSSIFVTGTLDAVRLHPQDGFQIVDYKLSRGANLRHDLLQLAIYARILDQKQPKLNFSGCLEYYLPALDELKVAEKELLDLFDDLVEPVLFDLADETPPAAPRPQAPPPDAAAKSSLPTSSNAASAQDDMAEKITECFRSFKLPVTVTARLEAPQLIRYTLRPATGVRVVSLANRAEDLQVALQLPQPPRIEPSADGVTIDIPKPHPDTVLWREIIERSTGGGSPLSFPIGVAVDGSVIAADLAEPTTCHALVAGASGSGKSEWLKSVVATLVHQNRPDALRLALIDPKMLTFSALERVPHLLGPVMTDIDEALGFLGQAVVEMNRRYGILAKEKFSNLRERHAAGKTDLPFWIVLFDEFADLILAGREQKQLFEETVARLAGKARAAGIHLILATQRPDRNIVTGRIKANLPLKVCLRVTSAINSQIVLEEPGAEKLLGRGDLLCDLGRGVHRAQSPFVTPEDLAQLTSLH